MKDKDDILIQQFITERMPVVEDMGFTHRVMRHLPRRTSRSNRRWTLFCTIVGVVMIVATNSIGIMVNIVSGVWGDMIGAIATTGTINSLAIIASLAIMIVVGVMVVSTPKVIIKK